ncbi:nicotinamidase [Hydrogenimonas urashimensis]|uniref:nicotinamidase n=1 Tax=Hydrogenimonas urashimensis TaxID=2740515 RepID=UPI00191694E2|nr:nicotinamidase [Hydrogenimonas urashimensis]
MRIRITETDALIVVDMQKDFMPGGALPVPGADTIVPVVNKYVERFAQTGNPVYLTRDWHPDNHISFSSNGGVWPKHCRQHTEGAAFAKGLAIPSDNRFIVSKGVSEDFDAYSGFQGTILESLLRERGVKRVFVCGVATDYCVKHTVLGAENLGFRTVLLEDALRGVDVKPGDSARAVDAMLERGSVLCTFEDLV